MTMLDLARISYEAQRTHFSIPRMGVHECEWDELSPDMQARYVDGARAVLLAIREPDTSLVVAIERHIDNQYPIDRLDGRDLWTEAIDAILQGDHVRGEGE